MAFVSNEKGAIKLAGFTPPLVKVFGTYLSSGGGTGGIISPGFNNSSGTLTAVTDGGGFNGASFAAGARKIVGPIKLTPTLSDATQAGAAIAYNTTRDRDEATIVTTADTGGMYEFNCIDNGS